MIEQFFFLLKEETQTGTTTPDQSGPGSNGNERLLHISLRSRWFSVISRTSVGVGSNLSADIAIGVFYNPSRLGEEKQLYEFFLTQFNNSKYSNLTQIIRTRLYGFSN